MSTDPSAALPGRDPDRHASADRAAAVALLAGSLVGLGVMTLHPTGRDAVRAAAAGLPQTRLTAVHVAGLLVQPLLLAGTLAVTRRLRAAPAAGGSAAAGPLAVTAAVYFACASAAALVAATASGLVAPLALRDYAAAGGPARAAMLAALDYTRLLNRSFARLDVLFTGAAVLLWSAAMLAARPRGPRGPRAAAPATAGALPAWPRALAGYGLVLGVALAAGAGSGRLRMDVHGFGLAVVGQGVWLAGVAVCLWRRA
jgi:hypothetical protein